MAQLGSICTKRLTLISNLALSQCIIALTAIHMCNVHQQTFKKELDHMVELGILEPCGCLKWVPSAFIMPKEDGTVMSFAKYKYKWLPMGCKCAPDFAQKVMEEVLQDVDDTGVYLDNFGVFSFTWEHHILLLDKILPWLEAYASPSICSNVNEPSKKLNDLDIGSHPLV